MSHLAAESPFAARMMERPMPEGLSTRPEDRFFFDPPELIAQAFGGRPWFFETGCTRIHRLGLFGGLGWELDPIFVAQQPLHITGVQVRYRMARHNFSIRFVNRLLKEDHLAEGSLQVKIITSRIDLNLDQLKPTYLNIIGGYVGV